LNQEIKKDREGKKGNYTQLVSGVSVGWSKTTADTIRLQKR
jgi:hypothetical protein